MVVTGRPEGDYMNTEPIDGIQELLDQAQAADDAHHYPPLTSADTIIKGRLIKEPPAPEALITYNDSAMLTRGCVGGLVAAGGTGKTMLFLQLGIMMASAGNIGPLKAPKPLNGLLLIAEDPQDELDRRLWRINPGKFPDGLHAISVAGKVGPLMQLDNGNPERSRWYDWLRKTIENHENLDVLMIDPKSRFYGLDENNNDHCTQWIACLESLAVEFKVTILFAHHVSKAKGDELHQSMSRGGSAIADGVRWLVGLTPMNEKIAVKYGVNPRNYIEMDLVKANYVAKLPHTLFFKRDNLGVLHYSDLEMGLREEMTQQLVMLLSDETTELTRRDLKREKTGNDIAEEMKKRFPKFTRNRDMDFCIDYGIHKGWLEELVIGTKQNHKTIIRVRTVSY